LFVGIATFLVDRDAKLHLRIVPLETHLLEEALGQSEIWIVLWGLEPTIEILIVPLNSILSATPHQTGLILNTAAGLDIQGANSAANSIHRAKQRVMANDTEDAPGMVHKKSKAINSIPSYANSHKEGCPQSEIQISKIKILIIRIPVVQLNSHVNLRHPISGAGGKTIRFKVSPYVACCENACSSSFRISRGTCDASVFG